MGTPDPPHPQPNPNDPPGPPQYPPPGTGPAQPASEATVTWHSVSRKIDKGGIRTVVDVFKSGVHSEAFEMETPKPPTERAIRSAVVGQFEISEGSS